MRISDWSTDVCSSDLFPSHDTLGYAAGYKKDIDLEMLDPTGVAVEKWILQGVFLTNVDFDSLGYSEDGLITVKATLRPERCILVY